VAYSQQIRDFQKRMDAIPQALLDELLAVNRKNAYELADAVRQLASHHSITGELVGSIKVTEPGQMTPAFSLGGARIAGPLEFVVSVGNEEVRHAAHVEFGTVHAKAQPFFYPAVRALGTRHKNRVNRVIRAFVKKWSAAA